MYSIFYYSSYLVHAYVQSQIQSFMISHSYRRNCENAICAVVLPGALILLCHLIGIPQDLPITSRSPASNEPGSSALSTGSFSLVYPRTNFRN